MALQKEIELDNGVILNYHRITSLNKITNMSNTIEVNSYVSKNQREKEQEYQDLQIEYQDLVLEIENETDEKIYEELEQQRNNLMNELQKGINVLVEADYIQIPYDENMTIEDAYEYLKTTEKYKNAEDV